MKPAVLVTGGAGYVGSHACKALAQSGYLPVVVDNLCRGHRWAVKWGPFEHHDLADKEALRATLAKYSITAVLHFAAYAYVGESMGSPNIYFRNNVVSTLNLLDVMLEHGVKSIVFSSTCAIYGMPQEKRISEHHPQDPVSPYGESKRFVEAILRWYGEAYGLQYVALRYFNAAGADLDGDIGEDHVPESHLIPLTIQSALESGSSVDIFGTDYPTPDGTAVRDYVHVADLADAHVRALQQLYSGAGSGAFNLGTGHGYSVREIIDTVERISGVRGLGRDGPRRPGDPPSLIADPSKAVSVLGWRAQHSDLDAIVRSAIEWHRSRSASRKSEQAGVIAKPPSS